MTFENCNNIDKEYVSVGNETPYTKDAIATAVQQGGLNRGRNVALILFDTFAEYEACIHSPNYNFNFWAFGYDVNSVKASDFRGSLSQHPSCRQQPCVEVSEALLENRYARETLVRVEVTAAFDMVHQNQLVASRMNIRNHSWACEKTSATSSSVLSSLHSQLDSSQGQSRSTQSFGGMDNDYSSSPVAEVNEGLSLSYSLSPVAHANEEFSLSYSLSSVAYANEELSLSSHESPIPGCCGRCTFQNSTSALVCSVCNTNLFQPNGLIAEIPCSSCTLLNSASNVNCTMCGSTLQEFTTLARPSRPHCAGPRQGPINSDNVNRGKNQHTIGSEILRGIPLDIM